MKEVFQARHFFLQNITTMLFKLCMAAINGAVLPIIMFLTQGLIDAIAFDITRALQYVLMLGVVFLISVVGTHIDAYLTVSIHNKIDMLAGQRILDKCQSIPYDNFENPSIFNDLEQLLSRYKPSITGLFSMIYSIVRMTVMILGIYLYLRQLSWWVTLTVAVTIVPVLILSVIMAMREYDTFSKYFPFLRKGWYLSGLITGRSSIKESRLFQFKNFIEDMWELSIKNFHDQQVRANLKPRFIVGICYVMQYGVVVINLFFLSSGVFLGTITVGVFIAVAQALWNLTGSFQRDIIKVIRDGTQYIKFKHDVNKFFCLPSDNEIADDFECYPVTFNTIVLQDIWYRYKKDLPYILKGVNLTLTYGDKIGIVGENGSGKSTLIKILIGLLAPTKGTITLDGTTITDANRCQLRAAVSIVFQDYGRYNLTLAENITLGRLSGEDEQKYMENILASLYQGDNFLDMLRDKMNTKLGKERWDGQDLSGGQWQIVALARAIFSKRPLLVLDEPTAELDPITEVNVYKYVYNSSEAQSVIIITHRLGAVIAAHRIYLLNDGQIAESGTHAELISSHSVYERMFAKQSEWYVSSFENDEE